jgi:hypothetical protein
MTKAGLQSGMPECARLTTGWNAADGPVVCLPRDAELHLVI